MKISITGSLGNISRVLIEKLVANGHEVKVLSSNAARTKEIESLQAIPLIGSVDDYDFVLDSFKEADAVYTMVPPDFKVLDYTAFSKRVHENYAKAIEENKIKYVVNLSSVGSALAGKEPLARYYNLENRLNEIVTLNIVHLRPCMFYTNFYGSIVLIKHQGIIGHNVGENVNMQMTHPHDIAETAYNFLNSLSFTGQNIKYIVSDEKTGKEIAEIIGAATERQDLKWMQFSDEQLLEGLMKNGFSKDAAQHYIIDMGVAIRSELLNEHFKNNNYEVFDKIRFATFAKEFAMVYKRALI
jgi:nucleoside-diphosphate-sugar epimerase